TIEPALLAGGLAGPAEIRARDVGAIAEGADEVGVEAHEIPRPDRPVAALLEPGIGALARGQDPRLDPLATEPDVGLVQDRPELVLGHAGPEAFMHARHPGLADRDRLHHAGDLVLGLDGARQLAGALPVKDLDPERFERVGPRRV